MIIYFKGKQKSESNMVHQMKMQDEWQYSYELELNSTKLVFEVKI